MHNITCIVLSNTDDLKFLKPNLEHMSKVFKQVIITIGDHYWNGDEEDVSKIEELKHECSKYDNFQVMVYKVPEDKIKAISGMVRPEMYWEGHARWIALDKVAPECEYVLFLDSDEMIDCDAFDNWANQGGHKEYDAMKLQNYWYWRNPTLRAKNYHEDSTVLIKKNKFNPLHIFSNMGRHGVFEACTGAKARDVTGIDGTPFIHHYSWVRTHQEMLRKVKSWGHRNDRQDWVSLVDEEFSRPFNGTDFLKNLEYDKVEHKFNIKME